MKFICKNCNKIFTADPIRKEYHDPIFGPCFKYIADCPQCDKESNEYRKPKPQKAGNKQDLPSCASGSCSVNGCSALNQGSPCCEN